MRGGEDPSGTVSIWSWSPLFFGCPLNLVLYIPFRIFAYSSNILKANFDLMDFKREREEDERGKVDAVRGAVTSRIGPALFGCLCCTCCCACPCRFLRHPAGDFIHWRGLSDLKRFEFVLVTPCLASRLPLTSSVPLSSFLPCVLVLPFALFY
jgi:hypothetical protein